MIQNENSVCFSFGRRAKAQGYPAVSLQHPCKKRRVGLFYPQFSDEETEARSNEMICLQSQS